MYAATTKAKELFKSGTGVLSSKLVIEMTDGNLEISNDDIYNVTYTNGTGDNGSITIGGFYLPTIEIKITPTDTYIKNKWCTWYVGISEDGSVFEWIPVGRFIITDVSKDISSVTLQGGSHLVNYLDKQYSGGMVLPISSKKMLENFGHIVNTTFDTTNLVDFNISVDLAGRSIREIVGYIAAANGMIATTSRTGNSVIFHEYADCNLTTEDIAEPQVDENNVTIDRLVCNDGKGNSISVGTTYAMEFTSPLVDEALLNTLYSKIGGMTYRIGNVNLLCGNPLLDIWDIITVEYNDTEFKMPVAKIVHTYDGGLQTSITVPAPTGESGTSYKSPESTEKQRIISELTETKELVALKANISDLDVTNANIDNLSTDLFNANLAIIENAKLIKVNADDLTAVKGDIEVLNAVKVEVEELTAEHGRIANLEASTANIESVLAGSAGVGTLQTINLTADNVTIDEAVVKGLIASEIAVSDLKAGTINTSLFDLRSQSGNLTINDNTIKINDDSNNTRIQIGKDQYNDYSLYVYDANGNCMLNSTGVTDYGINQGAIRNDMIANNANISGDKINISSLITNINDGTETINSSKILVDSENQTLDVSFKSLKSTVQSGNQNLLNGTRLMTDYKPVYTQGEFIDDNGLKIWKYATATSRNYRMLQSTAISIDKILGKTITVSFDVQCDNYALLSQSTKDIRIRLTCYEDKNKTTGTRYRDAHSADFYPTSDGWHKASVTFNITDLSFFNTVWRDNPSNYIDLSIANGSLYEMKIRKMKIECGTIATEWCESIDDSIALQDKVTSQGTNISVVQGKISSKIWEDDITTAVDNASKALNTTITNNYNSVTDTLTSHTQEIANITSNAETMSTQISTLSQTLTGFQTTVSETYVTNGTLDNTLVNYATQSSITQLSDSISTKVEENGVISSINQSPETITINAERLNINGLVTFSTFDSELQIKINGIDNTATSASETIGSWCYNNDTTIIDGGKLATGTITTDKLNVNDLSALNATIGGYSINDDGIEKVADVYSVTEETKEFYLMPILLSKTYDITDYVISSEYPLTVSSDEKSVTFTNKSNTTDKVVLTGVVACKISNNQLIIHTTSSISTGIKITVSNYINSFVYSSVIQLQDKSLMTCLKDDNGVIQSSATLTDATFNMYKEYDNYLHEKKTASVKFDILSTFTTLTSSTGDLIANSGLVIDVDNKGKDLALNAASTYIMGSLIAREGLDTYGLYSSDNIMIANAKYIQSKNASGDDVNLIGIGTNNNINVATSDNPYTFIGAETQIAFNINKTKMAYVNASGITNLSDERLKNSITDLSDKYIQIADLLKPKTYRYNNNNTKLQCGFIAQDIIRLASELDIPLNDLALVDTDGEYYGINYIELIPILWGKVQQLNKEILKLKGA